MPMVMPSRKRDHLWTYDPPKHYDPDLGNSVVTMHVDGESNITQMLDSFRTYLLACGYHIGVNDRVILETEKNET